ncbi:MAG: cytochrome b [Alphaproteobacteria bacterium]|nr:cytochrome b [Alphaproteobacteria bacterium]
MPQAYKAGRYGAMARLLHWLTAAFIVTGFVLGKGLATRRFDEPESLKLNLFILHESIGLTIFFLTALRLWWRTRNPPPPLPADLPWFMRLGAHLTHFGLYGLLLVIPVTGFVATNAWGFPLDFWWIIPLPNPVGHDEAIAQNAQNAHFVLTWLLVLALAAHVGAALYHQYVRRDGILDRML